MSELTNISDRRTIRWQLLSTVSALALLTSAYVACEANAADDDADRPTVWIELGGEMDHITGQGEPFTPGFLSTYSNSSVLQQKQTPTEAQNPLPFSFGGEGKVSFQPEDFDWVFSASIRYGRAGAKRDVNHQTHNVFYEKYNKSGHPASLYPAPKTNEKFINSHVSHAESHSVLDFQVGKDVGLGLFGRNSLSVLNVGVRFAQFSSRATVDMRAQPDLQFKHRTAASKYLQFPFWHTYHAAGQDTRSFHGIGPSLSWNASAPFIGDLQNGELTFDWGANAALLFGRQKASVGHHESGHYFSKYKVFQKSPGVLVYQHSGEGHSNVRTVTMPNVGGFAGVSFEFSSAKVSLGYRADLFFNAMDVGIDTRKSATLGFYGPFASVSVGLGG